MIVPVTVNVFNKRPNKDGHVVTTKVFLVNPNPNDKSMDAVIDYVQLMKDFGCRVEAV